MCHYKICANAFYRPLITYESSNAQCNPRISSYSSMCFKETVLNNYISSSVFTFMMYGASEE